MIVALRHGLFPLNERTGLTGEAAERAMQDKIPADADYTMDLLPPGRKQAARLQPVLADLAVAACLRSPALRAETSARIAFAGRDDILDAMLVVPDLRERSRGRFAYVPDVWAWTQPDYPIDKSYLDWQPTGVDYNGHPGETIRQVCNTRTVPVLRIAHKIAPGKTVALSTHAQWMSSLRAKLLNFDDERFGQPLVPNPPGNHPALTTAKVVINGQADMYDCICPTPNLTEHADIFRTVITEPGLEFDSGWLEIESMR